MSGGCPNLIAVALTQVRLQGTLDNAGYATASPGDLGAYGTLRFKLLGSMRDTAGNVVVPGTEVACAVVNGAYDITVFATDSPGVATAPAVLLYTVTLELVVGNTAQVLSYGNMPVPAALAGGGFGLDDLVPIVVAATDLAAHIADTTMHGTGRELGYAESQNIYPQVGSAASDIPGMTSTVTTTGKPISVEFGGFVYYSTAAGSCSVYYDLYEDGVQVGRAGETCSQQNGVYFSFGHVRRVPAPGTHIYKLKLNVLSAGVTGNALGAPQDPIELSIVEHP